mmetsp:Transcript_37225/g.107244  ORF Transcript_37225/g.107244 Transcript_37225/m.107244 type:complete len:247 (+) Transcript_37225:143-883(+)
MPPLPARVASPYTPVSGARAALPSSYEARPSVSAGSERSASSDGPSAGTSSVQAFTAARVLGAAVRTPPPPACSLARKILAPAFSHEPKVSSCSAMAWFFLSSSAIRSSSSLSTTQEGEGRGWGGGGASAGLGCASMLLVVLSSAWVRVCSAAFSSTSVVTCCRSLRLSASRPLRLLPICCFSCSRRNSLFWLCCSWPLSFPSSVWMPSDSARCFCRSSSTTTWKDTVEASISALASSRDFLCFSE